MQLTITDQIHMHDTFKYIAKVVWCSMSLTACVVCMSESAVVTIGIVECVVLCWVGESAVMVTIRVVECAVLGG